MRLGLAGPSYIPYSSAADSQRTVNLFPEPVESGRGKAPVVLLGTPGLETRVELSSSNGIKAIFYDTTTRRIFAVKRRPSGTVRLSELTTTDELADTEVDRGLLLGVADGADMTPASIASNGIQLLIICPEAGKAFVFTFSTNTLTEVTSEIGETNPKWGVYLDGYFIALDANGKFYLSSINDGTTWDAVDVATPESSPDTATMLLADDGELWIFGPESVEVWVNTGDPDFPFAPQRHLTLDVGLLYTYSVVSVAGHLFWVSRHQSGPAVVVDGRNYKPEPVSNFAVAHSIQNKVVTGAAPVAWAHQHLGHFFYILTFPDDNLTWAFDPALGPVGGWHERMYLNGSDEEAHRGRCCEFVGGEEGGAKAHLVGDRANGKVYSLALDAYDDDGDAIRHLRRAQHISNEQHKIFFHELELDVDRKVGEAEYHLRYSNDGGKTFRTPRSKTVDGHNPVWRRLGSGRDRVFEVYSDAAVKHVWLDAYIDLSEGIH